MAIRITVAPVPVDTLLSAAQLNKSTPLVALGLISLVGTVFIAVPGVIIPVTLIVVALVVLALPVFFLPVLIILWASIRHHRKRRSKHSSQKQCAEKSVSTVHVVLLWRKVPIRRTRLTSLSALVTLESDQY